MSKKLRVASAVVKLSELSKSEHDVDNYKVTIKSLLNCCIAYVADNLHFVDSFQGFPDIIAEQIFNAAVDLGKFRQDSNILQNGLRPFADAYASLVVDQLQLSCQHLVFNNNLETLNLFTHLTKLDISCCGVGDQIDQLHYISRLNCLQVLTLRGNSITDDGVRKVTARLRMFKDSLRQLSSLDLSDNLLTIRCLKYLVCFPRLQIVNLSNNKIECYTPLTKHGFHLSSQGKDLCKEVFHIENQGWAASVIDSWCQCQHVTTPKKAVKPSFYHKTKMLSSSVSQLSNSSPEHFSHVFVSSRSCPKILHDTDILTKKPVLGNSPSDCENVTDTKICHAQGVNPEPDEDYDDLMKFYSSRSSSTKTASLSSALSQCW